MNKQEYLIITFHSLDDAMDLDAKQTSSMKGRLIPKPSVIDAGCGMCFSCQNKDMEKRFLKMNKQEYLIITFHSLDDAMDLDAKQTSSMKGRLIPKPSVIDAGCGMCFSCQNKDMEKWKIFLEENQIHYEKIVKVVF